MAINPNLETISSGYNISKINSNFQAIGTALQDAVSRSGQAPNQMDADFDMNGNDILNVDNIDVNVLTVDGVPIVPGNSETDPDALIPVGGTDGQVLTKTAATDYAVAWETLPVDGVQTIVAGTNISVDSTDPANPIISSSGGGGDITAVDTRTDLALLDTALVTEAFLREAGREGLFKWDPSDLSSVLTIDTKTSTTVDSGTDLITIVAHGYLRGEALVASATVNGLTAGTTYFVIRSDEDTFKLATTWANAFNGSAINLTGTTNLSFTRLLDPEQGVYVVKTGDDLGGANGAWVRVESYLTADLWGAKHDGVTDDTRAMNAAALFISQRGETLNLLPGTYFIDEQTPSSYAARAIGNYNIAFRGRDGWRVIGSGMDQTIFTTGPNGNYAHIFFVMDCQGWEIGNIGFIGNNTGLGGSDNNGAIFPYSVNKFYIHDIATSIFQGSHFVGNFWFNGTFERLYQSVPAAASGFDCASIQNVTVAYQYSVGAGTGSGQGFQHSFDTPNDNQAFNTTGVTLRDGLSNNFRIINGDYSGFATGVAVFEADDFTIEGNNIHDNYKSSGDSIYGALISPSESAVMRGVKVINNRFKGNGTPSGTAGVRGGLFVNSNVAAVHVDIRGNEFFDNAPAGIAFFASTVNASVKHNIFGNIDTSDQTLDWSGTPLLVAETFEVADAATNTSSTAAKFSHTTSGTAAANLAVGTAFEVESAAGNKRIGARIDATLVTATNAAEDFALDFYLMKAGAAAVRFFRMSGSTGKFVIGDSGTAGVDFGVSITTAFPQTWQYSVSAANGNLYYFDSTNGKFPMLIQPNVPDNTLVVGTAGVRLTGSNLSRNPPVTKTADFTVGIAETWLINNKASACVVTLPAAASFPGRELHFTNQVAQTLTSASSNVVPKIGGAAGTAILAATDGVWATLVSDGTNWIIMQAGT
jgi:hypothetical protein